MFRSKCPSYVGTTGILVQEFKHVFKIITKENRLKGLTDGTVFFFLMDLVFWASCMHTFPQCPHEGEFAEDVDRVGYVNV